MVVVVIVVVLMLLVVRGGSSSGSGGGLGCAVERIEHGKQFGDAACHVIDCGYLLL